MSAAERFDAVILGAGPGGEVALNTLATEGLRIALLEENVIGGECSNWGCIPTKTLLRPTELKGKSMRAAGVMTPALEWPELSAYRDYMVSDHDDSKRVAGYEGRGVTVIKGRGRIAGPGRVEADSRVLETDAIIVATGSEAVVPPIPGLAEAGYWTNREATDLTDIPESAVVIGGGAVGIELAQFLARFGSRVTLVQGAERLADREAPEIGDYLGEIIEGDGIDLRLNVHAQAVRVENGTRGRRTWAWRPSASSPPGAASPSTSNAAQATACGRSATSPASPRSRTWRSIRAGSPRWTSWVTRPRPTIAPCRASRSPTRK
jgi:pyruvate/2-oxoglutarate dehydrogenase complex dihydrolipoamide dehydrogenase (E3) component